MINDSDLMSPAKDGSQARECAAGSEEATADAEVLQASIKLGTVAQIVIAVIAVIGLIYLLKLVLVTTLASLLLAYVLEPLVRWLSRLRIPRWAGALVGVLLTLFLAVGVGYFSFNSAVQFTDQLPDYSTKIRDTVGRIWSQAGQIENHVRSVVDPPQNGQPPIPVKIQQPQGISRLISENSGTILDILLALGFVPFLVYFMLNSKDHFHVVTVRLFPKGHRLLAHRTVGSISAMIRSYIVANVVLGVLNAAICSLVFCFLGIRYFYFIGAISGFLSLIPYLGVFLALLPPLAGGVDTLSKTGIVTVLIAIVGLHVITVNLIFPKFVGKRLRLNPLIVSLSLLFWTWIWGAPGLIFAIPILGAAKIICDHIDPLRGLGSWLGESARI